MDDVPLKIRVAVMWVFIALTGMGQAMTRGFQEQSTGQPLTQLSPEASLWGAGLSLAIFAIPVLCVTLRDPLNRRMNLVLGFFFTVAGIAGTGSELLHPIASNAGIYLMEAAATVAPAIVMYWAYQWPKV